jgi:hypothetical protein
MSAPFNTVAEQQHEIVRVARGILDGSMGVIAGAREMTKLHFRSHSKERDEDFLVFVGIDSETDHLPLGDVRRHWSPDALARKDVEIREAEDFFREQAHAAARALIARYDGNA